jgi:programmed cell death 6-interacting protein
VLDQEAEEDESFRNQYGSSASRPASHEVNGDFIAMGSSHRQTLEQAGASDRVVKQKWEEWEDRVEVLGGDEVRFPFSEIS